MTNNNEVKFIEESHQYFLGDKELQSVSKFYSSFFPTFDTKTISKRVAKSRRNKGEKNSKGKPITAWDVRREWEHKKNVAIAQGNLVHTELEMYINGEIDPAVYEVLHPKTKQGIKFLEEHCVDLELTSEEMVGNEEYKLAGTIDIVARKDGVTYLFDWKSNEGELTKGFGNVTIDNTKIKNDKISKYYLQLQTYKKLLELKGDKVEDCTIVHLRDDEYILHVVPDYSSVVDYMFSKRLEEIK